MEILGLVVASIIFIASLVRSAMLPDKYKGLKFLIIPILIGTGIWIWQSFTPWWNTLWLILISFVAFMISRSLTIGYLQRMANRLTSGIGLRCHVGVIRKKELSEFLAKAGSGEDENLDEIINAYAEDKIERETKKCEKWIYFTPAALVKPTREEQNFLLAHEISHHYLGHIKSAWYKKSWGKAIVYFMIGFGGGLIGLTIFETTRLWHNKKREFAADKCGVELLVSKGMSPYGAIKFFQKMTLQEKKLGWFVKSWEKLFGTHPMSEARLKNVIKHLKEFTGKEV